MPQSKLIHSLYCTVPLKYNVDKNLFSTTLFSVFLFGSFFESEIGGRKTQIGKARHNFPIEDFKNYRAENSYDARSGQGFISKHSIENECKLK